MMSSLDQKRVVVTETGLGPYGQSVRVGRHVLASDEPELLGGRDAGPAPYDYLMAALGACTSMTIRMYAERHRWSLRKTVVELGHEKAVGVDGSRLDRFQRTVRLEGDLTDEQRARLLEIAEKCPVSQTLQKSSIVVSRLEDVDDKVGS